jgi:hypothetical protein
MSVHVLITGYKGFLKFTCPLLHAEYLYHPHNYLVILMLVFAVSSCTFTIIYSSYQFIYFLVLSPITFVKLLVLLAWIFPISMVLSHGFGITSNLCICREFRN